MADMTVSSFILKTNVGLEKSQPSKKLERVGAIFVWQDQDSIQFFLVKKDFIMANKGPNSEFNKSQKTKSDQEHDGYISLMVDH